MLYMLWDFESSNLVAECDSEREALHLVFDAIVRHGASVANTLSLQAEDTNGGITTIVWGPELADRAQRAIGPIRNAG